MDRNDEQDFDTWLTSHNKGFDTAMREGVNSAAVLRAVKRRSAEKARREIENRVAVAAVTGSPPSPEPDWPSDRWEGVDDDFARLTNDDNRSIWSTWLSVRPNQQPLPTPPECDWRSYGIDNCGELVTAMNQGQRGAWERIVALVTPLAQRYIRAEASINGAPMDKADDLVQKALLVMLKDLPSFYRHQQGQPFLEFAYKVLRREVRKNKRLWLQHTKAPVRTRKLRIHKGAFQCCCKAWP
jgi:hypothetical protein